MAGVKPGTPKHEIPLYKKIAAGGGLSCAHFAQPAHQVTRLDRTVNGFRLASTILVLSGFRIWVTSRIALERLRWEHS